ncbi:MAG: isocitrate lyase/PEP mutase family protein [Ardenticatenaceae bacterium]|nr:isocitrate lyase/PEP mutase family protein [Ardenticatenaceae bacterium]HBY99365.1 carboxyvinyl-carboxyphosphonate phosphorylmutase [Chloroflexota bacterium]
METKSAHFRRLLAGDEILIAPGAYDALSAKIIEQAGFSAISATGAGISASLGYPDVGLVTMSEVVARIKNMADATTVPLLADADTGYGNAINVIRTVREFESAGAAGIHIEDQVTPKKCGQLAGKELISVQEMVKKIEAALEARRDPDFVIVARTDARSVYDLDEAIRRANAFAGAGADAILIYGAESKPELRRIGREVRAPLIGHISKGGKVRDIDAAQMQEMGYRMVIFPLQAILAAAVSIAQLARELRAGPSDRVFEGRMGLPAELYRIVGLQEVEEQERRFVTLA